MVHAVSQGYAMLYTNSVGQKSQTDRAMDLIMNYIRENNLNPGDRLPSEREMVELFSIGRQSIREAIKVLSMMNILDVHKQGGTFVSKSSINSKYDYFKFYLQSGQINISEIFEARQLLECECISLAATRITPEQLENIERTVASVNINDAEGFAEADRMLHSTIYAATGNRALELLMQTVKIWAVVSQNLTNAFFEVRQIVHKDHLNICEALRKKDPALCREAMKQHITHLSRIQFVSDKVMREEFSKILNE